MPYMWRLAIEPANVDTQFMTINDISYEAQVGLWTHGSEDYCPRCGELADGYCRSELGQVLIADTDVVVEDEGVRAAIQIVLGIHSNPWCEEPCTNISKLVQAAEKEDVSIFLTELTKMTRDFAPLTKNPHAFHKAVGNLLVAHGGALCTLFSRTDEIVPAPGSCRETLDSLLTLLVKVDAKLAGTLSA